MTNEEIFKEWVSSIPDDIGKVLDDFALAHTYPVHGVLRKTFTKAIDVARNDEAINILKWVEFYFGSAEKNFQLYQEFKKNQ